VAIEDRSLRSDKQKHPPKNIATILMAAYYQTAITKESLENHQTITKKIWRYQIWWRYL